MTEIYLHQNNARALDGGRSHSAGPFLASTLPI
jgi:hypothetical protein